MFAGIYSSSIVPRNISLYNGIRLTLRSNHLLKLKLNLKESFGLNYTYEALWLDTSGDYQTYELPFLNFISTVGELTFQKSQEDIQPELRLIDIMILAE